MYALNFYSPIVADQLRSPARRRRSAWGQVRQVPEGDDRPGARRARYSPRDKIFDAVIDKVEVKTIGELSPREIEHDNPEIRRPEDMQEFLGQLYNREVSPEDTVTVIRFCEIRA